MRFTRCDPRMPGLRLQRSIYGAATRTAIGLLAWFENTSQALRRPEKAAAQVRTVGWAVKEPGTLELSLAVALAVGSTAPYPPELLAALVVGSSRRKCKSGGVGSTEVVLGSKEVVLVVERAEAATNRQVR